MNKLEIAISVLGEKTPEEIIEFLRKEAPRGNPRSALNCPLAVYFTKTVGEPVAVGTSEAGRMGAREVVKLGPNLTKVIELIDGGAW